jgi:hypothetical protein
MEPLEYHWSITWSIPESLLEYHYWSITGVSLWVLVDESDCAPPNLSYSYILSLGVDS